MTTSRGAEHANIPSDDVARFEVERPRLRSIAYRMTGNRDDADDVVQDTFLKAYRSYESFAPGGSASVWLNRIASNCAIDHLRRRRPQTCPLPSHDGDGPDGADCTVPGTDPTPHDMLALRELQGRLEGAIGSLPAEFRQLILLRHRQHCRYDEIARITELPIGTVKNRIFRAREMLRADLADLLDGDERREA